MDVGGQFSALMGNLISSLVRLPRGTLTETKFTGGNSSAFVGNIAAILVIQFHGFSVKKKRTPLMPLIRVIVGPISMASIGMVIVRFHLDK